MHARTIHNVLAQGRTVGVQRGGLNPPNTTLGKSHPGLINYKILNELTTYQNT